MDREKLESKTIDITTTNEVEGKVEAVFSVFNEIDSDGLTQSSLDMESLAWQWYGRMIGKNQ